MAEKQKPKKIPPDDPEQSKRFEETARLLEADETVRVFESALASLLAPSKKDVSKKKKA